MSVIRVFDSDGDDHYNLYFDTPSTMTDDQAKSIVGAAIQGVKQAHPHDYMFEDLMNVLDSHGIKPTKFVDAEQEW